LRNESKKNLNDPWQNLATWFSKLKDKEKIQAVLDIMPSALNGRNNANTSSFDKFLFSQSFSNPLGIKTGILFPVLCTYSRIVFALMVSTDQRQDKASHDKGNHRKPFVNSYLVKIIRLASINLPSTISVYKYMPALNSFEEILTAVSPRLLTCKDFNSFPSIL
jgi:hypothetical protein